ncbi:MAG TPA: serine/threonine-protein kinase [Myxococcaceae bacterium]|jgi:serine/threonine-protein kinase
MSTKTSDSPVELPASIVFTAEGIAYELIRDLGVGLHGEQMLLVRPRLQEGPGAPVVVKALSLTADAQALQRLEQEIRLASMLEHPAITRVYGAHRVEGALYTLHEYVEGRSLDELYIDALLCGSFCSERFVLYVTAELASALHAAHTLTDTRGLPLGIVHRDLHPERIRLSPQGQVKLGGFGLAASHPEGRWPPAHPAVTGPVVYAAPEQLLQRPVDARADLFSLGLVMLELLTGHHLYRMLEDVDLRLMGLNMSGLTSNNLRLLEATIEELGRLHEMGFAREGLEQLARRATSFNAGDVERLAQSVPEPTRRILHKLLRHEPEERYASAAELEQALRERLQGLEPYGALEAAEEVFLLQAEALGLASVVSLEEPGLPPRAQDEITTQPA